MSPILSTQNSNPPLPHAIATEADAAVLVLDSKRRISQLTPRAAALLGREPASLIGTAYAELPPLSALGLAVREIPLRQKSRRPTHYLINLRLNERPPNLYEQQLASWKISAELAILRSPEGVILAANEAFARKFGVPRPQWQGRRPEQLVHPDDQASYRYSVQALDRPPFRGIHEDRWQTAQGWRWLAWEEMAVRDDDGFVFAYRAIGRDVTKRRLAEEHFSKLASAVEQSPFSIIMASLEGRVQYVNPKFTQSTGYTIEEVFEQNLPLLEEGHVSTDAYEKFQQTIRSGQKWSGEMRSKTKGGRELWELVHVSPIRNHADEVTHLLCMREDLTERKKLEDQLRQVQKMESIGVLAGGIAHDFNNILAIINGFAEIALSRAQPGDAHLHYVREIHSAAQRAIGLVRQILAFSRKTEASFRDVSINQQTRDMLRMCEETFPRTISFLYEMDDSLPLISADPSQLEQVIMNLCVNARDAMPHGGQIKLSTSRVSGASIARLSADSSREYICLTVADTGSGMPPHIKARIFEPFFTTKPPGQGTGLGLSVVYGIILNHSGYLEVDSVEGQGTSFKIYLPIEASASLGGRLPTTHGINAEIPPGNETILVVEDEICLRELLKTVFEPKGYRILSASDGAEALKIILSEPGTIDAALLDLNLPKMGGVEIFENLQRMRPHTRTIVMSGHVSQEARDKLMAAGPVDFLSKPYSLQDLAFKLRRLLDTAPASAA